ncbi:MAG: hypothetical protein II308_02095 [Muribaculaceae bacterium]|nr:hypothetical protein [Muribaculaceae bacterium]
MMIHLVRIVAGKWLLIPLAIFITSIALAFLIDLRYVIVAMMVLLILVPMMMAFLYIYYGLAPGCWQNIIEKELEIVDDGINVKMYIYPKKDKIDEQDSKPIVDKWADFDKVEDEESTEEVEDSTAEESMPEPDVEVLHRNRLIRWNEIKQMKVSTDRIFLTLTDRPLGFLHIPISSLSDATAFIQVLKSRISVK